MEKHLWEAEHPYYCAEQNARAKGDEAGQRYDSFEDFLEDWGDADLDYSLLFRWDWLDADKENQDPDPNYRFESDELKLCWMLQRIGDYRYCVVKVKKEDEEKIIEYLKPRWEYMKSLWSPL